MQVTRVLAAMLGRSFFCNTSNQNPRMSDVADIWQMTAKVTMKARKEVRIVSPLSAVPDFVGSN